jgi:hypothetical protein
MFCHRCDHAAAFFAILPVLLGARHEWQPGEKDEQGPARAEGAASVRRSAEGGVDEEAVTVGMRSMYSMGDKAAAICLRSMM